MAVPLLAGCSAPVDLTRVLQVSDVSGGYFDAGLVDGRNKIVPSITFRIKKSTDELVQERELVKSLLPT